MAVLGEIINICGGAVINFVFKYLLNISTIFAILFPTGQFSSINQSFQGRKIVDLFAETIFCKRGCN
jgi:hypothetical protein